MNNLTFGAILATLGAIIVLSLVFVTPLAHTPSRAQASGNTWNVDWRGDPANFHNITEALNSSLVNDGDKIYVYWDAGVAYNESVHVDKSVTIIGYQGTPIIDGGGLPVFNVTAPGVTLVNLGIRNGTYGIKLCPSALGCNITSNSIFNNTQTGIYVNSSSNLIDNNNITENWFGMSVLGSNNSLTNNTMTGNNYNFGISSFTNYVDSSNVVDNQKRIYVWTGNNSITVPLDAGYVAIADSNNVTVKDLPLSHDDVGITLSNTTLATISNVTLTHNGAGLKIIDCQNIAVENANATFNGAGIDLTSSYNCQIVNTNASFNGDTGIDLRASNSCQIFNSFISNNGKGINFESVDNSQILDSSIMNNVYFGIYMNNASGNNILGNTIQNTTGLAGDGVWDAAGGNNTFFHNNFENNNKAAEVLSLGDLWDNGGSNSFGEGNYWDTLTGVDANGDGILDSPSSPHLVDKTHQTGGCDWFPLASPWTSTRVFLAGNCTTMPKGMPAGYNITLQSNHVIAGFDQHWQKDKPYQPLLSFNITAGSPGYCNITIPRAWLDGPFTLKLNNASESYSGVNQTADQTTLFFTYSTGGTFRVEIDGTKTGAIQGDVTGLIPGVPDGKVDMRDIGYVARYFGYGS